MISEIVDGEATLEDPVMDRSNIGDSSTGRSTQPAMLGNTRELATSLVEMKIALRDLSMDEAAASEGGDAQQPPGDAADALNEDLMTVDPMDGKDSHEDPMNVDDLPTGPNEDVAAEVGDVEDQPGNAARQAGDAKEALLREEGVAQQEQSVPSSGDLPMIEANPANPMDPMVTKEPVDQSPLRVTDVIPSSPPPHNTQPKEILQSTLDQTCMNVEVVDDIMQDLDPFSPASKALILYSQPLAIQEVLDFPDSSQVALDSTFDDQISDPNEPELNLNLYEGLMGKAINEVVLDLDPMPQ